MLLPEYRAFDLVLYFTKLRLSGLLNPFAASLFFGAIDNMGDKDL